MSTYWHLRCPACREKEDEGGNHAASDRAELLGARAHIEELLDLGLDIKDQRYRYSPILFIEQHRGHALEIVSEYGDLYENGVELMHAANASCPMTCYCRTVWLRSRE